MKAFLLTLGSMALSASVVTNAYYQKKQFYPSVVYITKSNPSMAVLYLQAFVFVILMGKLIRKVFFGQLRAAEMEHLIERSWYAVTETCLAFTVFRDDFSPRFVALFTLLLFLKCFHWLAEDRVDYMERSPVISLLFHVRAVALLAFLGAVDVYFINHAYYSTLIKGASVQLVFGFEYAILLTMVMTVLVKYLLHTVDLQSENPWENKAVYMLYTDLVLGFIKVVLYVLFLAIMIKVHTFPLFAIRPMYLTMRAFKKALNDVIMSRRAIRNMNTLYPDATEEDLASGDNVCIICREDMTTSCKKLPCSHIFHTNCLRSWFQRQQTCPTCRMDVLRRPVPRQTTPQQPPQPQLQPQAQQPGFPGAAPGAFPGPYGMWLPPAAAAAAQAANAGTAAVAQAPQTSVPGSTTPGATPASTTTSGVTPPGGAAGLPGAMPPFMMMPPFPFMPPFGMPPPVPPADLRGLTEEELHRMEGVEQRHLAARVQWLHDIHATLDAAMLQIQQYTQLCNSMGLHTGFTISTTSTEGAGDTKSESSKPKTSTSKPNNPATTSSSVKLTPNSSSSKLGTGAESSIPKSTQSSQSAEKKEDKLDYSDLEGAVGYSEPKVEFIPEWTDPHNEEESDEMYEMRRRRLARFSSEGSEQTDTGDKVKDNLALD